MFFGRRRALVKSRLGMFRRASFDTGFGASCDTHLMGSLIAPGFKDISGYAVHTATYCWAGPLSNSCSSTPHLWSADVKAEAFAPDERELCVQNVAIRDLSEPTPPLGKAPRQTAPCHVDPLLSEICGAWVGLGLALLPRVKLVLPRHRLPVLN